MAHDSLQTMRQALQPHLCGTCHTEADIQEIIEQCAITKSISLALNNGVSVVELRNATKAVMDCLKKSWRQTEFERFMCILLDGGHVTLDNNLELVPA